MPSVPLKFALMLQTRDGTSASKDARITNLLIEPHGDDETHFLKRPGFVLFENAPNSSALGSTTLPNGEIITFSGIANGGTNNATVTITAGYSSNAALSPSNHSVRITLTNNNLTATSASPISPALAKGSVYESTGKWYCEVLIVTAGSSPSIGLLNAAATVNPLTSMGDDVNGYEYASNGQSAHNSSLGSYAASWTTGDRMGIAFDAGGGTLTFYKNNATQGQAFSGITGAWTIGIQEYGTAVMTLNFGPNFFYPPPAGYSGWPNA